MCLRQINSTVLLNKDNYINNVVKSLNTTAFYKSNDNPMKKYDTHTKIFWFFPTVQHLNPETALPAAKNTQSHYNNAKVNNIPIRQIVAYTNTPSYVRNLFSSINKQEVTTLFE